MSRRVSGFLAAALIAFSGTAMVVASFEAEAKRAGSGSSVGRQSTNVTSQRQATTPPAATSTTTAKSSAAAPAAGAATAGAAASGASRWLGPLAGIAAGLGIAALLSHLGLSGAFADFLVLALIAAAVVFGVMFSLRRMRGGQPQPAIQAAGAAPSGHSESQSGAIMRESLQPTPQMPAAPSPSAGPSASFGADATQEDLSWFIPQDFDTHRFLQEAKQQFVAIQKIWDSGDIAQLRNFMTDDLVKELEAQLKGRSGTNRTDVVLLNAELLGIEKVSDGHLASVRFSGMLREEAEAEAFRFEEVWNLYKPEEGGWLLAGIQQVPLSQAS